MPTIQLQFSTIQQLSLQMGDTVYYATMDNETGGFQINDTDEDLVLIGTITNINSTTSTITCNIAADTPFPTTTSFILFAKDSEVNTSSLLGYYGSAKFINDSSNKAEMFSVGCEINESSK